MLPSMGSDRYSVSIVLDRNFGQRLRELLKTGPVWAVDSPTNRDCAQKLWAEFPARDHLDGVTIFKCAEGGSPEQVFINHMGIIDDHHGVHSANPPYTAISVFGSGLTPDVRQVLGSFGFDSFTATNDGFEAIRPLPPPLGG
jgi:hypothetical protein